MSLNSHTCIHTEYQAPSVVVLTSGGLNLPSEHWFGSVACINAQDWKR